MSYYWLSFCDANRPEGERFIGGCLVEADGVGEAVEESWRWRCNPGGEIAIVEIGANHKQNVPRFRLNYLYSKQDIEDMGELRTLQDAIDTGDVA
jgi:hypothetical protein